MVDWLFEMLDLVSVGGDVVSCRYYCGSEHLPGRAKSRHIMYSSSGVILNSKDGFGTSTSSYPICFGGQVIQRRIKSTTMVYFSQQHQFMVTSMVYFSQQQQFIVTSMLYFSLSFHCKSSHKINLNVLLVLTQSKLYSQWIILVWIMFHYAR